MTIFNIIQYACRQCFFCRSAARNSRSTTLIPGNTRWGYIQERHPEKEVAICYPSNCVVFMRFLTDNSDIYQHMISAHGIWRILCREVRDLVYSLLDVLWWDDTDAVKFVARKENIVIFMFMKHFEIVWHKTCGWDSIVVALARF